MRDLQILLQRLGFIVSGGNTIGMYNFFAQFGERDTAYVSRASRLAAPGWDAIDIVFGDYVPARMMRDLEREMRDSYRFRYFTVTRVGGRRVWIMTLQRMLKLSGVSGGAAPEPPTPPTLTCLSFNMPYGGTVTLTKVSNPNAVTLEYTKDRLHWTEWEETGGTRTAVLDPNETIWIRNTNENGNYFNKNKTNYYRFSFTTDAYADGDITSLIAKEGGLTTIPYAAFAKLFFNSSKLRKAPDISCINSGDISFYQMFKGSGLIQGPDIVSIEYVEYQTCNEMFMNCSSMNNFGDLYLANIEDEGCKYMFRGCSSLQSMPSLEDTVYVGVMGCYGMFGDCVSFQTISGMPNTEGGNQAFAFMFESCYGFVSLGNVTFYNYVNYGTYWYTFDDCVNLRIPPILPALQMEESCYEGMFSGCTSLEQMPNLPSENLAYRCYASMFDSCESLERVDLPAQFIDQDECYAYIFSGCTMLSEVYIYASSITGTNVTNNWLYNVSPSGTVYHRPDLFLDYFDTSGIPDGWSEDYI